MKGWLDNFGKADNANDSEVNLPEGFVGLAYDTKGRNYSPAWGGQFAMGGSIPGSVGFTYARVAGAAPSKGKYAKKTMASAQIGKNVKKDETNIDTGIANKIAGLELQQNPEYQRLKYLQSLPQLRQAPGRGEELVREGLATADIATDLMQIGNFIPHPMAQGVGKAGNILGSGVDLAQALMSARQGNYLDAAINLGSVGLAGGLASSTFRRNSKYLQPGQPLYALSPQAFGSLSRTNYIEPFRKVGKMTDKNLLANRALLGLIGAETVYDAIPQKEYGGEIPSAQNGQEMRFYQNGLDWKPKSMQNGGDEIKFNPVTNQYELPEVVVEGKDERMKNAMSQGMANLYGHVGELMGAPQKEMMQLITGKEQTPSEAFGFQNTGGWLDSYSSFGKNAFNFGLDALGDPVNAIPGIGMIDDISRLSLKGIGQNLGKGIGRRAISQAPSPQMMVDNIAASATPNASTVSSQPLPYRELDHPHMDLLQELKQKTIDRIDTPEGRRRLQYMINKNFGRHHESWGKPVEGWGEFFLHGLKSGQLSGYKKLTPDDIIEEIRNLKFIKNDDPFIDADNAFAARRGGDGGYGPGSVAAMYMGENNIPGDIMRIFDHEMAHIFQRNRKPTNLDDKLSKLELKTQPSSYPDSPISEGQLEDVDFSKSNQQWGYGFYPALDYFLTGSRGMEKLPFAAEVRQSLLRRGKIKNYYDEITPQMIEDHYDLYNKTGGNKSILRLYEIMEKTPKNFQILSETLNKLPAVTLPIAGGAAATISALQNQQPVQKQKNGGITKDNLGYWNPDNWGKPVEIGSNNITMEGVYEPLLGISDTGDTKLMQPGKNYKFKGKKVTEFPVAKLGINQLDAQPMKKLNQLLNFTNNPDKDNWLDKYN